MNIPSRLKDFRQALQTKQFVDAEIILERVRSQRPDFPEWTDAVLRLAEINLITVYITEGQVTDRAIRYQQAKRVIEDSFDMSLILGRRRHLEKVSGLSYERI